jgi:hypothetical protein
MDPKQIARQMIQFNKAAFDKSFNAIIVLQEQIEKLIAMYMDQVPLIPEEGKKAIADWMKAYKKGREEFKGAVEGNYKKVEDFFAAFDKGKKSETADEPKAVKARPLKKAKKKKFRAKKVTNIDTVVGLIQGSAKGISTTELKEKTGLAENQIWNIVNQAAKAGKVKKIKWGIYGAA